MNNIWNLFTRKQNSLGSAAIILMLMVIISGLLGLIRLRILYNLFTAEETGVFFAAFRLPNFLFEILALGSITSAFIPVFTRFLARQDEEHAGLIASTVINITIICLILFSIPVMIWTQYFSKFLAPGFSPKELEQMIFFTRFLMVFQVFPLIIGNYLTGILQSYKLFIVPALAPILYNLGMIIGILTLSGKFGMTSTVIGVFIGAILFFLVHIPILIKIGFKYRFVLLHKDEGVREIIRLMIPRLAGLSVSQIDVTIDLMLSSILGSKMVSVFYLAQSMQQLPVRLFGLTISQAVLPSLSTATADNDIEKYKTSLLEAYNMILFFVLPASVFYIVLRMPLVRLAFGATMFDWEATVMTAVTLSFFSISLAAQAISQVLTRGFYALYDTKTPVFVGIFTILVNSFLSVMFVVVYKYPIWSLALSTTIASIINALLLLGFLYRKAGGFPLSDMFFKPLKMLFVSLSSGFAIYVPMKLFDELVFDTTRVFGLVLLTLVVSTMGLVVYMFLSWVFDISEVHSFLKLFSKVRNVRSIFVGPGTDIVSGEIKED